MRLPYQHGYGRLVDDEYCSFWDYAPDAEAVGVISKSRGILSIDKITDSVPYYAITLKRDFPVALTFFPSGEPDSFQPATIILALPYSVSRQQIPPLVKKGLIVDPDQNLYEVSPWLVPSEANPTVSRQVNIYAYRIGYSEGKVLTFGRSTLDVPVSIVICRPLSREWYRKIIEYFPD
jgi:hypothetical protein